MKVQKRTVGIIGIVIGLLGIVLGVLFIVLGVTSCGMGNQGQEEQNDSNLQEQTAQEQEAQEQAFDMVGKEYLTNAIIREGNTQRLEAVMQKAAQGEAVTIAYIGGSITQGSGASSSEKCYASLTSDWWEETYPEADFTFVNAGIGATDSRYGCLRVEEDVLEFKPDLVFVEFSVNDGTTMNYEDSYESLLRKILLAESEPAVIIINTVQYSNGINAQDIHNRIAWFYDLAVLSMKDSLYAMVESGEYEASYFSDDGVHPNDTGYEYMTEIIAHYLLGVQGKMAGSNTEDGQELQAGEDVQETYVVRTNTKHLSYLSATYLTNRNAVITGEGFVADAEEQEGVWDIFNDGWEATTAGDTISFEVTGSKVSLVYRKTNRMSAPIGTAMIDGLEETIQVVDGNFPNGWGDWLYMQDVYSGEYGEHVVTITLTEDGANGFYLCGVVVRD